MNRIQSKYASLEYIDFLRDDYFISSHISPTQQSREYWSLLICSNSLNVEEYNKAKEIILHFDQLDAFEIDRNRLEALWQRISLSNNQYDKRRKRFKYTVYASAASLALAIGLFFAFSTKSTPTIMDQLAFVDIDKINEYKYGSSISLLASDNRGFQLSRDSKLDYSGNTVNPKQNPSYNHLVVPYGQATQLVLPDKTTLFVKGGTHVIFPTQFLGSMREIYVDGEVYAEVKKQNLYPFKILNKSLEMTVLGTKVNFRAYDKETDKSVVLLTGKVSVNIPNEEALTLSPNERYLLSGDKIKIEIVDPQDYIFWVDGVFNYDGAQLTDIFNELMDFYNVQIKYEITDIENIICSGNLKSQNSLEEILEGLCYTLNLDLEKVQSKEIYYKVSLKKTAYVKHE